MFQSLFFFSPVYFEGIVIVGLFSNSSFSLTFLDELFDGMARLDAIQSIKPINRKKGTLEGHDTSSISLKCEGQ